MSACPTCGTGVPDGAKFCTSCGRTLTGGLSSGVSPSPAPAPAPIPEVLPAQYLADPEWYEEEDESERRSPIVPAILGALAALILVASVGGFVLLKGKADPAPSTTPATTATTGGTNATTNQATAPATSTGASAPTVAGTRAGNFAGTVTFPNFTVSIVANSTAGVGPSGQVLDAQVKACLVKPVSGTSTPMSRSAWRARLANGSTIAADPAYNDPGAYAVRKVLQQGECSEGIVRFRAPAGSGGVSHVLYANASGNTHTFTAK